MSAIVGLACVALVCGSALVALKWVLRHRELEFTHIPLAEMQRKLEALEAKILSGAFQRR